MNIMQVFRDALGIGGERATSHDDLRAAYHRAVGTVRAAAQEIDSKGLTGLSRNIDESDRLMRQAFGEEDESERE